MRAQVFALAIALAALSGAACAPPEQPTATGADELIQSERLGMTDVSILYPPPEPREELIPLTASGARGVLLPKAVLDHIADVKIDPSLRKESCGECKLFDDSRKSAQTFGQMRVVGVRIDPCFGGAGHGDARSCRNVIRLVAQPYVYLQSGQAGWDCTKGPAAAFDPRLAFHLIYDVGREELLSFARSLREARNRAGFGPAKSMWAETPLSKEGPNGPYGTRLKELLLELAGERTLSGVAFMIQDTGPSESCGVRQYYGASGRPRWTLGGVDYRGGRLSSMDVGIQGYAGGTQTFLDLNNGLDKRAIPSTALFETLARASEGPRSREAAVTEATKLQNPGLTSALTTDCVSCHFAKSTFAAEGVRGVAPGVAFQNPAYDLRSSDRVVEDGIGRDLVNGTFRMFGHGGHDRGPIVSARVVHESAMVADALNAMLAP